MKITCQSEIGALQSVALKHAKDALVNDAHIEKEWAALNFTDRPNFAKAIEEYNAFEAIIKNTDADVFYFPEDPSVTMD